MTESPESRSLNSDPRRRPPHETDALLQASDRLSCEPTTTRDGLAWCRPLASYFIALEKCFGAKLLILIVLLIHLLNGFVRNLTGPVGALPYLFRLTGTPAPLMGVYEAMLDSVGPMAPLIALATDLVPIMGFNRSPYVIVTSLLGVAGCLGIWLLPDLPERGSLLCLVMLQVQVVTALVCCQGTYVQKLQRQEAHGQQLQIFVSFGLEAAGLVGNAVAGPVVQSFGPKAAWGVSAVPALGAIAVALSGFFGETRALQEEVQSKRLRFWEQRAACGLTVVLFACGLANTSLTIGTSDVAANLWVYSATTAIVLVSFGAVLSPAIARVAVFSIMFSCSNLNISTAMFYFYTDTPGMLPNGPHFSTLFFNSVRGPVMHLFALLGLLTYYRYMKDWSHRKVFLFSSLIDALMKLSLLMIVTRANVRLGIPDKVFVLIHVAMGSVSRQWLRMPFRVVFMYMAPPGMEATMYALLKGTNDFGRSMSDSLGGALLQFLGVRPSGQLDEASTYQNLQIAVMVTAFAGLAVMTTTLRLVPDTEPNKTLVSDIADVTSGSLWSTWFGAPPAKQARPPREGDKDPAIKDPASAEEGLKGCVGAEEGLKSCAGAAKMAGS